MNYWTGKQVQPGRSAWSFSNAKPKYVKAKPVIEIGDVECLGISVDDVPGDEVLRGTIEFPDLLNVGGDASGSVQYSNDLVRAAQKAYPNLAGKTQLHHITPKYLGGASNGPLVPLDSAYHQQITNAFRAQWGYGLGKPSPAQLRVIMNKVYSKFPLPPGYTY